jgi:hypothetical protein
LSSDNFSENTVHPEKSSVNNRTNFFTHRWGYTITGLSSSTLYFDYGENASFELFHGPVTIQRNGTSDSEQSYLVMTNITLKNTGLAPVEVIYGTVVLKDDVGEGCTYNRTFTCGIIGFGTHYNDGSWLNPGESETQSLNVTIFSSKSFEYLTSQKFVLEGVFDVKWKLPGGRKTGVAGDRREWLIDLNQTEIH